MPKGRLTVLAAGLVAGTLAFSACTSGSPSKPQESATQAVTDSGDPCRRDIGITSTSEGEIRFTAGPGDWNGYNALTNKTFSTYNSAVADRMFGSFGYFGTDGSWCSDKAFGEVKVVSESPLTVEYTLSDKAVWSDGTPITINDYLLDYATQNPEWLTKANGDAPVFDHVSTSFPEHAPDGPKGEIGAKKFTVVWPKNYPDWKIVLGATLPAHVVAKKSGLSPEELAKAIVAKDAETVKKTAKFWNEGWIYNPGELPADMSEVPSSGPYILKEGGWKAGNSLTLVANPKYAGAPAATKNLVFRFIADDQQVQTLENKEVSVISPQATVDTVGQLKDLGSTVTTQIRPIKTWEHLDFNFGGSSVFADSKGGLKLRQAFAYCVPRQGIVDSIIKPIQNDAIVMNAREAFPFETEKYKDIVAASYDGAYDNVDIEKSKALVKESGVSGPIKVRIGYRSGNARRTDTVAAIKASCDKAGFNVEDVNSKDFFSKELVAGDYEVALFAWAGSGQISSGQNIYATGKPQNYGKYSNATVDAAWDKVTASLDPKVHLEQTKIIEKELWNTMFGIPLYAHPGVNAWLSEVNNVRPTSVQSGVSWNAEQWLIK